MLTATDNGNAGATSANIDSARANLAGTFVNAFVNAGYGNDKLMVEAEEGQSWIYKNKDHGMMSAAASLGLSLLWDTDIGLSHVDKYSYSAEEYIKVCACWRRLVPLADGTLSACRLAPCSQLVSFIAACAPRRTRRLRS